MTNSTVGAHDQASAPGRCWVILDPRLIDNGSLDALRTAFANRTVLSTVWRWTSEQETGAQLAAAAVAAEADRVVVIGDEATIRTVASSLANTGVPLGIVPVGSGRTLARSIGAPTDPDDAIAVALGRSGSVVDLMKVTIDGAHHTSSFITVGVESSAIGPPRSTEPRGSLRTGPVPHSSFGATATVDQRRPTYRRSAACVIGIGSRVVSGARPLADHRHLHVSMLRAQRRFGMPKGGPGIPTGPRLVSTEDGPTGQRVLLVLEDVKPYYIDGALAGHATTVSAELQPDALTVLIQPRPDAAPTASTPLRVRTRWSERRRGHAVPIGIKVRPNSASAREIRTLQSRPKPRSGRIPGRASRAATPPPSVRGAQPTPRRRTNTKASPAPAGDASHFRIWNRGGDKFQALVGLFRRLCFRAVRMAWIRVLIMGFWSLSTHLGGVHSGMPSVLIWQVQPRARKL